MTDADIEVGKCFFIEQILASMHLAGQWKKDRFLQIPRLTHALRLMHE